MTKGPLSGGSPIWVSLLALRLKVVGASGHLARSAAAWLATAAASARRPCATTYVLPITLAQGTRAHEGNAVVAEHGAQGVRRGVPAALRAALANTSLVRTARPNLVHGARGLGRGSTRPNAGARPSLPPDRARP
jgi:hypothetical protein